MAACAHTTPLNARRVPVAAALATAAPEVAAYARRGQLAAARTRLDAIAAAVDALDLLDSDPDAEPDHDGEAEPAEASAQPVTLAPQRAPARQARGAAALQMAAAREVKRAPSATSGKRPRPRRLETLAAVEFEAHPPEARQGLASPADWVKDWGARYNTVLFGLAALEKDHHGLRAMCAAETDAAEDFIGAVQGLRETFEGYAKIMRCVEARLLAALAWHALHGQPAAGGGA